MSLSAQAAIRYQVRLEEAVNQLRVLGVYTPEYLEALKTAVVHGMSPQNIEHARLHRPTQPAPGPTRESETAHAHLCDRDEQQRDAIAKAINPRPWSERFMPFRCHGDDRTTEQLVEAERDRVRQTADAVLAVLHTRTVAQVKAEGVREAAEALREHASTIDPPAHPHPCDDAHEGLCHHDGRVVATLVRIPAWLNARADELEREDGR